MKTLQFTLTEEEAEIMADESRLFRRKLASRLYKRAKETKPKEVTLDDIARQVNKECPDTVINRKVIRIRHIVRTTPYPKYTSATLTEIINAIKNTQ
jgi:hypothetical protein